MYVVEERLVLVVGRAIHLETDASLHVHGECRVVVLLLELVVPVDPQLHTRLDYRQHLRCGKHLPLARRHLRRLSLETTTHVVEPLALNALRILGVVVQLIAHALQHVQQRRLAHRLHK